VPPEESKYDGECFVFDNRVSVKEGLEPGTYDMCHACRRPLDDAAKASPDYVAGVSCPFCITEHNDERRKDFAERQKQIELARARGEKHIGVKRGRKTG